MCALEVERRKARLDLQEKTAAYDKELDALRSRRQDLEEERLFMARQLELSQKAYDALVVESREMSNQVFTLEEAVESVRSESRSLAAKLREEQQKCQELATREQQLLSLLDQSTNVFHDIQYEAQSKAGAAEVAAKQNEELQRMAQEGENAAFLLRRKQLEVEELQHQLELTQHLSLEDTEKQQRVVITAQTEAALQTMMQKHIATKAAIAAAAAAHLMHTMERSLASAKEEVRVLNERGPQHLRDQHESHRKQWEQELENSRDTKQHALMELEVVKQARSELERQLDTERSTSSALREELETARLQHEKVVKSLQARLAMVTEHSMAASGILQPPRLLSDAETVPAQQPRSLSPNPPGARSKTPPAETTALEASGAKPSEGAPVASGNVMSRSMQLSQDAERGVVLRMLADANEQIKRLGNKLDVAQASLASERRTVKELEQVVVAVEQQKAGSERALELISRELRICQMKFDESARSTRDLEGARVALQHQCTHLEQRIADLVVQNSTLSSRVSSAEASIAEKEKELESLGNDLQNAFQLRDASEAALKERLDTAIQAAERAQEEVTGLLQSRGDDHAQFHRVVEVWHGAQRENLALEEALERQLIASEGRCYFSTRDGTARRVLCHATT